MPSEQKVVIMNFSAPPGPDDIDAIAQAHLDSMPEELAEYVEDLVLEVEELPDEALETDLNLDSPFDIFALYKCGAELSPGIISKKVQEEDRLILFRRPILDYWCELYEDLNLLIRQIVITEIGQQFDFDEEEIEELIENSQNIEIDLELDENEFA